MLSLILIFAIYAVFLIRIEEFKRNDESVYSIFAASLSLGVATNGLIGLAFVFLKITFFPLALPLSFAFLFLLSKEQKRINLIYFIERVVEQFLLIFETYKKSFYFKIILIFVFLMLIISIGPINHSDAVNAYVGMPYKYWLKNSHFIDGNLNQGLLGIGDFANIFYFQDKTTWLIRTTQFLPIIPILFLFLKRKINKIGLLIIFSTPVFIQWLTIGKTNFLSESCLAILFLVWEKRKLNRDLILLIALSFISISFKVSALLICIPIFSYLLFFYKNNFKEIYFYLFKDYRFICILLISICCLLSILSYRYYLYGNPFYPLLSDIFTPENKQLIDWEQLLKTWDRSNIFQFWIFFPRSIGKISFVLGPANFILFIYSLVYLIKNFKLNKKVNLVVGLAQFFILLFFAQGRADYYVAPLFITYSGIKQLDQDFIYIKNLFTKNLLTISIVTQVAMFIVSSLYMLFLSLYLLWDYETGMDKFAWNYYNSKFIMEKAEKPVFNETMGMSHLYFDDEFISNNRFGKCFYYENKFKENRYETCVSTLGIKTIIVDKDKLTFNDNFSCEKYELLRVSRNLFLTKKKEVDFCKLR